MPAPPPYRPPIERLIEHSGFAMIAWLCGEGGPAMTGTTVPVNGGLAI